MKLIKVPNWFAQLPIANKFIAATPTTNKVTKDFTSIQIVQEMADKNAKQIDNWRTAMTTADNIENPNWQMLQDLYEYIKVDAHTHSLISLRKNATLGSRYYIYDAVTGEEQPEKTAWFQSEWFYTLCSKILETSERGCMAAQLKNAQTMEFFFIPQRHLVPQFKGVRLNVSDEKYISLTDPAIAPYIIFSQDEYQFGYLNDIVPLVLWKLNVMMSWAEATEKYGLPPLIATTNKSNKKDLDQIQTMLTQAGESLTAVLPEGTKIEVMPNYEKVDPEKIFGGLLKVCKDSIATRIVGGTMIMDNGSSRSQSEVHQGNFDSKIIEADKRRIEFVSNDQLLPMMRNFGWKLGDNDRFAFDRNIKHSLTDTNAILSTLLNHYDVDEDWIRKDLQIPVIGKKQTTPASFNQANTGTAAAVLAKGVQLPNYTAITSCCGHSAKFTANAEELPEGVKIRLGNIFTELIDNIWKGKNVDKLSLLNALQNNEVLVKGLFTGYGDRRLQLSYDSPDVGCLAAMEYNIAKFSMAKSQADNIVLNHLLLDKEKQGIKTFEQFKTKAMQHLELTNINYLRAEYNHAIAVGQNVSTYHKFMGEAKTITHLVQWRTVGDSHVRYTHDLLNGSVFDLYERGGIKILPPKEFGCRCHLQQYIGSIDKKNILTSQQGLETLKISNNPQWNSNLAITKEVFTKNQFYTKTIQNIDGTITYEKYGLKSIKDMSDLPTITLDNSITGDNINELFKPVEGNNYMGYTDYLGRKLMLNKKTFDNHTKGHYINDKEKRHQLFPFIKDVLQLPNEVYFTASKTGKYQTCYIKHFKNNSICIVTSPANENGVDITTWFNIKTDEKKIRSGFLVHKK